MIFLGIGTTLGIIAQTVALVPALRRVGFRWRPRFDFQRADVAEIGRMSGWMFGYVLTTQVAYLVTAKVASYGGDICQDARRRRRVLRLQLRLAAVPASLRDRSPSR